MEEKKKASESKKEKTAKIVITPLDKVSLRGRKFEGIVTKKFDGRITIEFERTKLIKKYERYIKNKTKLHARLPESLKGEINVGDYVQIQECRPLSKILHHIVVKKIGGEK